MKARCKKLYIQLQRSWLGLLIGTPARLGAAHLAACCCRICRFTSPAELTAWAYTAGINGKWGKPRVSIPNAHWSIFFYWCRYCWINWIFLGFISPQVLQVMVLRSKYPEHTDPERMVSDYKSTQRSAEQKGTPRDSQTWSPNDALLSKRNTVEVSSAKVSSRTAGEPGWWKRREGGLQCILPT